MTKRRLLKALIAVVFAISGVVGTGAQAVPLAATADCPGCYEWEGQPR